MAVSKARSRLTRREQRVILAAGALAVLVIWLYAVYIVAPLNRASTDLTRQLASSREQLRALEVVTARDGALQEQYGQLSATLVTLRDLLPAEGEISTVIEQLTALANQTQVKILTISPQRSPDAKSAASGPAKSAASSTPAKIYEDVFIRIDALAGYHQLGSFLSLVEAGGKPMRITTLRIAGNPKDARRSSVKLLVSTFLAKGGGAGKGPAAPATTRAN